MKPSVLYVEERTSVPTEYLMPLITQFADVIYVSSDEHVPEGVFRRVVSFPKPRFNLHRAPMIRAITSRITKEHRVDIIHCNSLLGFVMPSGVPRVLHSHACYRTAWRVRWSSTSPCRRLGLLRGFLHYVVPEWLSVKGATSILSVSHSVKRELMTEYGVDDNSISVAVNCPDPALYAQATRVSVHAEPRIAYVGRITRDKGIDRFLRLFVGDTCLKASVTVIGDGPDMGLVREIVGSDSRVKLLGYLSRDHVYKELLSSNIFVFPSSYEGYGLALAEAMAAGNACVALDTESMRELSGGSILLASSVDSLWALTRRLCQDHKARIRLQHSARARAMTLRWQDSANVILETYSSLLAAGRKNSADTSLGR